MTGRPGNNSALAQLQVIMETGRGSGHLGKCHSELRNWRENGSWQKVPCPRRLLTGWVKIWFANLENKEVTVWVAEGGC